MKDFSGTCTNTMHDKQMSYASSRYGPEALQEWLGRNWALTAAFKGRIIPTCAPLFSTQPSIERTPPNQKCVSIQQTENCGHISNSHAPTYMPSAAPLPELNYHHISEHPHRRGRRSDAKPGHNKEQAGSATHAMPEGASFTQTDNMRADPELAISICRSNNSRGWLKQGHCMFLLQRP